MYCYPNLSASLVILSPHNDAWTMYIYPRTLVPRDISFLQQIIRDNLNSFFHLTFSGLDVQLGIER